MGPLTSRKIPPMDSSLLQADQTDGVGRGEGSNHVNGDHSNFQAHIHQLSPEDERAARRGSGRHPMDSEGSGYTKAIFSNGLYNLDQAHTADECAASSYVFVISSLDEESGRQHARACAATFIFTQRILRRRYSVTLPTFMVLVAPLSLEMSLNGSTSEPRSYFLSTGQGAHYHASGCGLMCQYVVFERFLKAASVSLQRLGALWRLLGS